MKKKNIIFNLLFKGDCEACFNDHETKTDTICKDVHTKLALKEEELKKTRHNLKEVTDEKEELLLKVKFGISLIRIL